MKKNIELKKCKNCGRYAVIVTEFKDINNRIRRGYICKNCDMTYNDYEYDFYNSSVKKRFRRKNDI